MIDFPLTDLLDDAACAVWFEQHLHLRGVACPRCQSIDRRLFRRHDYFATYRCRACQRTYTILTGSVFEKTRQRPSTIVLLLRGVAKGESTARLSRELNLDRKRLGELRYQIQTNLYDTLPGELMNGDAFEADELYQNAGGKKRHIWIPPTRRADAPINRKVKAPTTTTERPS